MPEIPAASNGATRLALVLLTSIFACIAHADLLDDLEFKHGIAFFQDLKYPADFTHFDYLNPNAPKGGQLVLAHPFSFNTLAPMPQGETGAPSGYHFRGDTLIVRSGGRNHGVLRQACGRHRGYRRRQDDRIQDPSGGTVG